MPEIENCSLCHIHIDDDFHNSLVLVEVDISPGEEGQSSICQHVCSTCLDKMIDALTNLGFKDHRHGGINYLEDLECNFPYGTCPHEAVHRDQLEQYGVVFV